MTNFDDYSDTVLYDVFFEAGTQLGGTLLEAERRAEQSGDTEAAARYRQQRFAMADDRDAVHAEDREGQARSIEAWRAESARLDYILDQQQVSRAG